MATVDLSKLNQLKELEKQKNDGRGVCCVRTVIFYLEKGHYDQALACCRNENDKIRNYADIQELLYQMIPEYLADWERLRKMFGWKIERLH